VFCTPHRFTSNGSGSYSTSVSRCSNW